MPFWGRGHSERLCFLNWKIIFYQVFNQVSNAVAHNKSFNGKWNNENESSRIANENVMQRWTRMHSEIFWVHWWRRICFNANAFWLRSFPGKIFIILLFRSIRTFVGKKEDSNNSNASRRRSKWNSWKWMVLIGSGWCWNWTRPNKFIGSWQLQ